MLLGSMHTFSSGEDKFSAGVFPPGNFQQGGKFPGDELARENFELGKFT